MFHSFFPSKCLEPNALMQWLHSIDNVIICAHAQKQTYFHSTNLRIFPHSKNWKIFSNNGKCSDIGTSDFSAPDAWHDFCPTHDARNKKNVYPTYNMRNTFPTTDFPFSIFCFFLRKVLKIISDGARLGCGCTFWTNKHFPRIKLLK